MKDNHNLIKHLAGAFKRDKKRGNHKINFYVYAPIFLLFVAILSMSYSSADATVVSLPATTATVGVNGMQGQNADIANVNTGLSAANNPSKVVNKPITKTANDVKVVNVASDVATLSNLSSTNSVTSNAESTNTLAALAQAEVGLANKRQNASMSHLAKALSNYRVKKGDNVPLVAEKFGISPDTLRKANNINGDALVPGSVITAPGYDGVVYTVQAGDSLEGIGGRYQVNPNDILAINDIDQSGVKDGVRLLLPDSAGLTLMIANGGAGNSRAFIPRVRIVSGNNYAYGYCTWYAYNRRRELGLPVAGGWGNANTWDTRAAMSGYAVDRHPEPGAIFQTKAGPYGHVGVVERVNPDGSIFISEMNYAGWNRRSTRTISGSALNGLRFIH